MGTWKILEPYIALHDHTEVPLQGRYLLVNFISSEALLCILRLSCGLGVATTRPASVVQCDLLGGRR